MKAINLIGQRFGRLIVVERRQNATHYRPRWLVQCDCGNRFETVGNALTSGNTKSCGCYKTEYVTANNKKRALPHGESLFNHLFNNYKREARRRYLSFDISRDYFKQLTSTNCFYCGCRPNQHWDASGNNGTYIYNGVDRKDNSQGYTIFNSVPCCKTCNLMKHTKHMDEFIQACQAVTDYQKELNASRNRGAI